MELNSCSPLQHGAVIIHHDELLHGGDGRLHIISIGLYLVALGESWLGEAVFQGRARHRDGDDGDAQQSLVKVVEQGMV